MICATFDGCTGTEKFQNSNSVRFIWDSDGLMCQESAKKRVVEGPMNQVAKAFETAQFKVLAQSSNIFTLYRLSSLYNLLEGLHRPQDR